MNTVWFYKIIGKAYDLLDVTYFRNVNRSPRMAVLDLIPKEKELKVLDLCTGTGVSCIEIAKARPDTMVVGVDRSKEMLRIVNHKIKKDRVTNIRLKRKDASHTSLPEKSFDVILLSLVLHECSEKEAKAIMQEASRLLKDSGKLLVTEWEECKEPVRRVLFYLIKKLEPKQYKEFANQDMKKYMKRMGFELRYTRHCDYTKVMVLKKLKSE
ncbi:MAG: class I SAM-dependent methyltransferase [bacterium]|nr:class I SAM-dependent methyltransferase [bacterium]